MTLDDRLRSLEGFLRQLLTWNMLMRVYFPWIGDFDLKGHVQTVTWARRERGRNGTAG